LAALQSVTIISRQGTPVSIILVHDAICSCPSTWQIHRSGKLLAPDTRVTCVYVPHITENKTKIYTYLCRAIFWLAYYLLRFTILTLYVNVLCHTKRKQTAVVDISQELVRNQSYTSISHISARLKAIQVKHQSGAHIRCRSYTSVRQHTYIILTSVRYQSRTTSCCMLTY
jgi:hypothetical protein